MEYDEQLERALKETPDIQQEGTRFDIPDPVLRSEGHETIFENFQDIVDRFGRDAGHVLQFLQGELGTSASIDENGRARFTGDFRESRVADMVAEYADAYVFCPECALPDTHFETERGTKVIKCEACGAISATGE